MNFFKVMMPGFRQKLKLPEIIYKELERQKSESVILESRLGRWKISMCRNLENDLICLSEGWSEFVERHSLSIGYFLVFEHTGDLHFNVSVFDSSACEKEYHEEKKEKKKKKKGKGKGKKEEATKAVNLSNPPKNTSIAEIIEKAEKKSRCFVKTMVPSHGTKWARVGIPKEFMRRYGLGQQTSATLRDPKGRVWSVTLTFGQAIPLRMRMGGGWHEFYASNSLKDGDVCVFKLKRRLLTPTTIFFDVQIFHAPS